MNQPTEKNRPVHKIRIGSVEAAIWRREKDGRRRHSVAFQRSFKTKEGKYQSLSDFNAQELLILREVARLAADWMIENDVTVASSAA